MVNAAVVHAFDSIEELFADTTNLFIVPIEIEGEDSLQKIAFRAVVADDIEM